MATLRHAIHDVHIRTPSEVGKDSEGRVSTEFTEQVVRGFVSPSGNSESNLASQTGAMITAVAVLPRETILSRDSLISVSGTGHLGLDAIYQVREIRPNTKTLRVSLSRWTVD